ncbi:MAG: Ig-like domain-containing protein [Lachnospiraceae bacterium]|nr:Ig-like domain-containing protein [Lachnospiraceae bacterium]
MEETGAGSVGDMGVLTRYAKAGGSFSYLFKVDETKTNYITCQYAPDDNGKTMIIKAGDVVIAEDKLSYYGEEELYSVKYEIPAEAMALAESYSLTDATTGITDNRKVLRISFSGAANQESPKLNDSAYTSTNYDNNPGIAALTSDIGTITKTADNAYNLVVPTNTKQIQLSAKLANSYGLLYVDDVLTDDTKKKTIATAQDETVINLLVYAEDHETSANYQLTIIKKDEEEVKNDDVAVASIQVAPTAKELGIGETVQLSAAVVPANATNTAVTYTSSNPAVATVNEAGLVTAKAAGTATITVASAANPAVTAACVITVLTPSIEMTGVADVAKGKSLKLKVKLNNISGDVKWSINSTKYATIKANGASATLKAKKKVGKVKVTVQVGDLKVTKTIQVVNPVKKLKLSKKSLTLRVKKTYKLKATVTPKNATNKKVTYTSSNPKVATVSANGKIKALKKGRTTITVQSKSNPKVKATCKITVKK